MSTGAKWRYLAFLLPLVAMLLLHFSREEDFKVVVPVYVRFSDRGFNFPDLIQASQIQLDARMQEFPGSRFRYELIDALHDAHLDLQDKYVLLLRLHNTDSVVVHAELLQAELFYKLQSVQSNDLPFFIVQAVVDHFVTSDLLEYHTENFTDQVSVELINMGKELDLDIAKECYNYFTNHTFNIVDFNISYATVPSTNGSFLFEPVSIGPSEKKGDIYKVYCPGDNAEMFKGSLVWFFDQVYEEVKNEFCLADHPSTNANLRLLSLIKHIVIDRVEALKDQRLLSMLKDSPAPSQWIQMYNEVKLSTV